MFRLLNQAKATGEVLAQAEVGWVEGNVCVLRQAPGGVKRQDGCEKSRGLQLSESIGVGDQDDVPGRGGFWGKPKGFA